MRAGRGRTVGRARGRAQQHLGTCDWLVRGSELVRGELGVLTFWNRSAERLERLTRDETPSGRGRTDQHRVCVWCSCQCGACVFVVFTSDRRVLTC